MKPKNFDWKTNKKVTKEKSSAFRNSPNKYLLSEGAGYTPDKAKIGIFWVNIKFGIPELIYTAVEDFDRGYKVPSYSYTVSHLNHADWWESKKKGIGNYKTSYLRGRVSYNIKADVYEIFLPKSLSNNSDFISKVVKAFRLDDKAYKAIKSKEYDVNVSNRES